MTEAGLEALWWWVFWVAIILLPALEYIIPRKAENEPWPTRWTTNIGFGVLNGAISSLGPALAIAAAHWASANGVGLLNVVAWPAWAAAIVTLLAVTLANYLAHVSMHKVPLLWRIHRVHHSDPAPNVSTSFRFHPLENAYSALIGGFAAIVFGFPPLVLAAVLFAEAATNFWGHANMRLPAAFERSMWRIVQTPGVHRLHHSAHQPETDSNYGVLLMIWDVVFGTFLEPPRSEDHMRFGLDEIPPAEANSFLSQVLLPVLPGELPASDREAGSMNSSPPLR